MIFRAVSGLPHPTAFPLSFGASLFSSTEVVDVSASPSSIYFPRLNTLTELNSNFIRNQLTSDAYGTFTHRLSLSELRSLLPKLHSHLSPGSDFSHTWLGPIIFLSDLSITWRSSLVVPIPEPASDPTTVSVSRPISRLSCSDYFMGRIVVARISWFLDKKKHFLTHDFGFRPLRTQHPITSSYPANSL